MKRFALGALPLSLALGALCAPATAAAQVEARCPAGWDALPAAGGGGQRVIAACAHAPMHLVAMQIPQTLPAGDPAERALAEQLAQQLAEGATVTAGPFRDEAIAGHPARVTDLAGSGMNAQGAATRVEGSLFLLPIGQSTVLAMALSDDAAHGNARAALRTFVPTMAGLSGAAPAWRASATCPAGMRDVPSEGDAPNGMRRVAHCASEQGTQFEVLESQLPLRNAADARAEAASVTGSLQRGLRALGGTATMGATAPVTYGGAQGFVTPLHANAVDPRAQPGAPGASLTLEGQVVALTTTLGHVQIMAMTQAGDAAQLGQQIGAFVASNLRLDGSGVATATATAGAAPAGDGGAETAGATPPPRRHEIDPNAPMWHPDEDGDDAQSRAHDATAASNASESSKTGTYVAIGLGALVLLVLARTFFRGSRYTK